MLVKFAEVPCLAVEMANVVAETAPKTKPEEERNQLFPNILANERHFTNFLLTNIAH